MVTDKKQRACPASLVSATINEKEQISKFITEKLVTSMWVWFFIVGVACHYWSITGNREYISAFASAKAFFTNSVNTKIFLFLTDGRRSNYDGVFGNVTAGWTVPILVYTANGNVDRLVRSFFTAIFLSPSLHCRCL